MLGNSVGFGKDGTVGVTLKLQEGSIRKFVENKTLALKLNVHVVPADVPDCDGRMQGEAQIPVPGDLLSSATTRIETQTHGNVCIPVVAVVRDLASANPRVEADALSSELLVRFSSLSADSRMTVIELARSLEAKENQSLEKNNTITVLKEQKQTVVQPQEETRDLGPQKEEGAHSEGSVQETIALCNKLSEQYQSQSNARADLPVDMLSNQFLKKSPEKKPRRLGNNNRGRGPRNSSRGPPVSGANAVPLPGRNGAKLADPVPEPVGLTANIVESRSIRRVLFGEQGTQRAEFNEDGSSSSSDEKSRTSSDSSVVVSTAVAGRAKVEDVKNVTKQSVSHAGSDDGNDRQTAGVAASAIATARKGRAPRAGGRKAAKDEDPCENRDGGAAGKILSKRIVSSF